MLRTYAVCYIGYVSLWLSPKVVLSLQESISSQFVAADLTPQSIGVVGLPRVLKALQKAGQPAIELPTAEASAAGDFAAIVIPQVGKTSEWVDELPTWREALQVGGMLLSIDRGSISVAREVSRRFLCSGYSNLSQCIAGRRLITSGLV